MIYNAIGVHNYKEYWEDFSKFTQLEQSARQFKAKCKLWLKLLDAKDQFGNPAIKELQGDSWGCLGTKRVTIAIPWPNALEYDTVAATALKAWIYETCLGDADMFRIDWDLNYPEYVNQTVRVDVCRKVKPDDEG